MIQGSMTGEVGGTWGSLKATPLTAMTCLQVYEILRSRYPGIYLVRVDGK